MLHSRAVLYSVFPAQAGCSLVAEVTEPEDTVFPAQAGVFPLAPP